MPSSNSPTTGQPESFRAPGGELLTYLNDGVLTKEVRWNGTVTGAVAYSYDSDFRLSYENGVSYTYDPDGLVNHVGFLSLIRDANTRLLRATSLGVVQDEYTYNEFAEVQTRHVRSGDTALLDVTYARDAAGRIESITETVQGASAATAFTYDAGGRLTKVTRDGVAVSEYDYDPDGNRIAHRYLCGSEDADHDASDRLLRYGSISFTYTPTGELAAKRVGGLTTQFTYDLAGNLRNATTPYHIIDYVIDAQNRRVGKKVDGELVQGWLYGDQTRVVAELDGSGATVATFVYGTRSNAPDYMVRAGVTDRIITDHLGSPRLVVNTNDGTVVQRMDFDEFGRVVNDTRPGFQPFGFAGGLYDRDTGLVRFGARDYDPYTGRWTAKAPIGFEGGDTNLYAYVLNDPIHLIDPRGTDWVDALESVANFSAGFGDVMTFGATNWVRDQFGGNEGIDRCSGAYAAGMYTEIAAEVALTGGSFALRGAAKGMTQAAARRGMSSAIPRGVKGVSELHHINPLKIGLFPTAPLPASVRHSPANLKILSLADHRAAHRLLAQQERALSIAFNPATTAGRVGAAAGGQCGCP